MPKRSNLFQQLALLVHKSLEPEWKVTESEMLVDSVTGEPREVDIVATSHVRDHQIVLSIECRDHARPADVTWVESMAKKHEHLRTSKLVLWSRSGFTKQALVKAEALNIDAISQAEATIPTWAHLARELKKGHLEHVTPTYKAFVILLLPDGKSIRFEATDDWKFYNAKGEVVGSIGAFIRTVAWHKGTEQALLDHAPQGQGDFWVQLTPPETWFADSPSAVRCQVQLIGAGIKTLREIAVLKAASATSEDKVVTLASVALQEGAIELIVEESSDASPRVMARRKAAKS